jgi:MHS family metabolite:H+ symporter-like MFS transporter
MISSVIGFLTIPLMGYLSDRFGRRISYIVLNVGSILLAYPLLSLIMDPAHDTSTIMMAIIVIHNIAVLGLFALENITLAELFGARQRFTRMAIPRRREAWLLVWPLLAGIFCHLSNSWWPIGHGHGYSMAGLMAALLMPEVKDRDLGIMQDADA